MHIFQHEFSLFITDSPGRVSPLPGDLSCNLQRGLGSSGCTSGMSAYVLFCGRTGGLVYLVQSEHTAGCLPLTLSYGFGAGSLVSALRCSCDTALRTALLYPYTTFVLLSIHLSSVVIPLY